MADLTRTPPTFSIMVEGDLLPDQTPEQGRWYCGFSYPEDSDDPIDGALAVWDGEDFVDEDGEPVDMAGYDYLMRQT